MITLGQKSKGFDHHISTGYKNIVKQAIDSRHWSSIEYYYYSYYILTSIDMSATNNLPTLSLEAAKIAAAAAEEKAKELGIGTSMATNLLSSTTYTYPD